MKSNFLRPLSRLFVIWLLIAAQACDNDPAPQVLPGSAGYFVVNEGGFGNSNTSISFYDREKKTMTNDVFAAKNARPLGDQAQGLTVFEGKAYIAVQNSGKVEVINADDYSSITTITEDIVSPRYFLGITSTKGYLSDWGEEGVHGTVKVIDLDQMKVTKTITTGQGANRMILKDGKVYVTNNGGYGYDNKISIIDTSTDAVSSTIQVGDNPASMAFDKDGNLWVSGIGDYITTTPWIAKIGPDNQVAFKLDLPVITYVGPTLAMNNAGDKFYYNYNGAVYAMATSETALPTTAFIEKDFYGLAVDPFNDDLLGCEAPDFSSTGKVYVYRDGAVVFTTFDVGIAPNGVGFK